MRASDDAVENLVRFFLLERGFRFAARILRWAKRTVACFAKQNVARVHHLLRLAVFSFRLTFFDLDDVEAVLALHHVTDFTRLQSKRGFFKLRNHLPGAEPAEVAALVFRARVS